MCIYHILFIVYGIFSYISHPFKEHVGRYASPLEHRYVCLSLKYHDYNTSDGCFFHWWPVNLPVPHSPETRPYYTPEV